MTFPSSEMSIEGKMVSKANWFAIRRPSRASLGTIGLERHGASVALSQESRLHCPLPILNLLSPCEGEKCHYRKTGKTCTGKICPFGMTLARTMIARGAECHSSIAVIYSANNYMRTFMSYHGLPRITSQRPHTKRLEHWK